MPRHGSVFLSLYSIVIAKGRLSPVFLNAVAVLPRNTGGGRRECKLQRIATLSKVPTTYILCLDTPSLAYVAPMDYWWREAQ